MIKGKVQIELHNHRTGLKDRIEQENMVTNAIQDIVDATVLENMSLPSNLTPLTTVGLGGLFLFDNTLTENANNVYFPHTAKLVARAGQYTDTGNAKRGSLNTLESGAIDDDTYMNVWDFNTSQANGIIKSLSLTNATAGANLFGYTTFKSASNYTGDKVIWYDRDEQYIYKTNRYGAVNRSAWLRTDFPINKSFSSPMDEYGTSFVQMTIDGEIRSNGYGEDGQWGCCLLNDYIYFQTYHDGKWWLAKLDPETWAATCNLVDLPTSDWYRTSCLCTANGYIYACAYGSAINGNIYGSTIVRKIDPTDFSYTDISIGSIGSIIAVGGLVYHSAGYLIYPDNTVVATGTTMSIPYGCGFVPADTDNPMDQMLFYGGGTLGFYYPLNYLGTICNLSTPVEKNSTTSMKVKYTITNA